MTSSRRSDRRFRPTAQVVVLCLDTQMVVTLADLGSGGFSAHSSTEVAVGSVMRFRFSTPDGAWVAVLTAQTVHSRQEGGVPGRSFILGFKFLNTETPPVAASVIALIDRATAVISVS